jgi:ribonuclease BN (tRNA processing enzyme)
MLMAPEVIREFHPVGHGAFFTERLCHRGQKDIIVVYDCGCSRKEELVSLEREINHFFKNVDEKIDYLFISHFDKDHVSGIKLLQSHIDNDTHLVMPFSYEYLYLLGDSPIMETMGDIFGFLDINSLYPIEYWVCYNSGGGIDNLEIPNVELSEGSNALIIESGTVIKCLSDSRQSNEYLWMYVPFNLYDDVEYKKKFEDSVAEKFKKPLSEISATDLKEEAIKQLRAIYKSIGKHPIDTPNKNTNKANGSKNINENSLIVLSKAIYHLCHQRIRTYLPFRGGLYYAQNYDGSCLYTGDSNLSDTSSQTILKHNLRKITSIPVFLMQLPHHGSRQYYNSTLLCDVDLFVHLFINCGEYDFKAKSFPQLLVDIVRLCVSATFITNNAHSKVRQNIYLY